MITPFIRNHQYNVIKKQVKHLQNTYKTVSDLKIIEAVKHSALIKITDAFGELAEEQKQMLVRIVELDTVEDLEQYLLSFKPYLLAFPALTGKQLVKLFPKVKKLKAPDTAAVDLDSITYLSWTDIAQNKLFIVYSMQGETVGIEGRFTPAKKGVCFLCNRHEEVALFTAITKSRPANASPDYYKAIGNYMCMDNSACNSNITDVEPLEQFISNVIK